MLKLEFFKTADEFGSHLFQRVASFLQKIIAPLNMGAVEKEVLISFREWLHSYQVLFVGITRR